MSEQILLQVIGMFLFSTELTVQAWALVILGLLGLSAVVAWLIGRAVLVWKRVFGK